jgi:uncharacterized protein YndB with AHSA1/START domain
MQGPGPDGQTMTQDGPGCYLLVEAQRRLVFTDAFGGDSSSNCSGSRSRR